ncbi:MAG: S8 family serine peptidase [Acidobacteriota bacterium]
MNKRIAKNLLKSCILFAVLFALQEQAFSQEYRKGELIVELKPGVAIETINNRWGTALIKRIYGTNLYRLRTPNGKKEQKWQRKLSKDANLLSVSLNPLVLNPITPFARSHLNFPNGHATLPMNPADYLSQELLAKLQVEQLRVRSMGEGVVVAIIDTGIDSTHPSIAPQLWADKRSGVIEMVNGIDDDNDGLIDDVSGWDFVDNDGSPSEIAPTDTQTSLSGHGTFIAGLISLIAPKATILPVRAFDADGLGDAFTAAEAIKYAADHGAKVINLSFGSVENSDVLHNAIIYARQRGAMLIAAVGNENDDTDARPRYPAAWINETMAVAAVDLSDHKATFSNFGINVSVAAPGVELISTFPRSGSGDFAKWSGTSFAAPITAAQAALILSRNPAADAQTIIESTADNINALNQAVSGKLGKGRVNPLQALTSLDAPLTANKEIILQATGVEPNAGGHAEIESKPTEEKFEINALGLTPRSGYKIFVNGAMILDSSHARAATDVFGGLKVEFSSAPGSNNVLLPAALNPVSNIRQVEVRDAFDRVVLHGDFVAAVGGGTGGAQTFRKEIPLAATAELPQAKGSAEVEIESERQELEVEGEHLISGATYQIIVDNILLGTFTAQFGYLKVELTSDGSKDGLIPAALLPVTNIQQVTILNQSGQVVLQGAFQSGDIGGGDDSGGGDDGGGDDGGGGGGGGDDGVCIEYEFRGIIQSLPSGGLIGDWQIDGKTVHVTSATRIEQDDVPVAVGVKVEVKSCRQSDGSVTAKEIKTRDD